MTQQQNWQTIALDLKRAGNYLAENSPAKASYYLLEAKSMYLSEKGNLPLKIQKVLPFVEKTFDYESSDLERSENLLLAGTLISIRI